MRDRRRIPLQRGLMLEDLLRFPEGRCKICNNVLNGENWSQSKEKTKSFVCKSCVSRYFKEKENKGVVNRDGKT